MGNKVQFFGSVDMEWPIVQNSN